MSSSVVSFISNIGQYLSSSPYVTSSEFRDKAVLFEKRPFLSIFSKLNISNIISGVYVKVY